MYAEKTQPFLRIVGGLSSGHTAFTPPIHLVKLTKAPWPAGFPLAVKTFLALPMELTG